MKFSGTLVAIAITASGAVAQVSVKPAESSASTRSLALVPAPNARWISRIYVDLLGRVPDPAATQTFVSQLDHGTTRAQIATQVVSSAEYRNRVVRDLFTVYLHRTPDPGAVSFWVGRLGSAGYLGVQKGILSSAEYLAARGGGSVDGFLNALYQDVLGRLATSGEHANLLSLFGGAGLSQKTLVDAVCGSGEGRAALVDQLYKRLLARSPDPAGASLFASRLGSGASEEAVLVEILSSDEYFRKS